MISIQTKNETKKQTLVKLCSARAPDRVRRENGLDADRVAERHHLEGAPAADDGTNAAPLAAERRPVPGLAPPLLPEICQIKSGRDAPRARVTPAQTGRRALSSAPSLSCWACRVQDGIARRGQARGQAPREREGGRVCGGGGGLLVARVLGSQSERERGLVGGSEETEEARRRGRLRLTVRAVRERAALSDDLDAHLRQDLARARERLCPRHAAPLACAQTRGVKVEIDVPRPPDWHCDTTRGLLGQNPLDRN